MSYPVYGFTVRVRDHFLNAGKLDVTKKESDLSGFDLSLQAKNFHDLFLCVRLVVQQTWAIKKIYWIE